VTRFRLEVVPSFFSAASALMIKLQPMHKLLTIKQALQQTNCKHKSQAENEK
jgi:hypothetical protein